MNEAVEAMQAPGQVKAGLPCTYILEKQGSRLIPAGPRVATICPFHDDSAPSLEVYEGDGHQRWGCWPCGKGGDSIDLIRAFFPHLRFTAAVEYGQLLMQLMAAENWQAPVLEAVDSWDEAHMRKFLAAGRVDLSGVTNLCEVKGWPFRQDLLLGWGVCAVGAEVLVPYYTKAGRLTGIKHRRASGTDHLFAIAGSALKGVFYGDWLPDKGGPVVLLEGESDTWAADWLLGKAGFTVLGLPTGAGTQPFRCEEFRGRKVHLCFDGDTAGRIATNRWAEALEVAGALVTPWVLGEGQDVCSLGGPTWLL